MRREANKKLSMLIKAFLYGSLLLVAIIVVALGISRSVQATPTKLSVEILPLNCVFEIIDTGTNQIRYITPKLCGKYVPPDPPPPTDPEIPPTTNPEEGDGTIAEEPSPVITPQAQNDDNPLIVTIPPASATIFLNKFSDFVSSTGMVVKLDASSKILFYVMSNRTAVSQHHIQVVEIGSDYVVLLISSDPFYVTLRVNETGQYDVDGDGVSDISITLRSVDNNATDLAVRGVNNWCQTYAARPVDENSVAVTGVLASSIYCNSAEILDGVSFTRSQLNERGTDYRYAIATALVALIIIATIVHRLRRKNT